MQIEFYGLIFETPKVTFYLWSPWRASALEHRLFDTIVNVPDVHIEKEEDEIRVHIKEPKGWKQAQTGINRVLKGWQEESDPGRERRSWRWLLEGDCDSHGFDHAGEALSLWGFMQLGLERGGNSLDDAERLENIDMQSFGLRIWAKK
jgi:hypothetical protein